MNLSDSLAKVSKDLMLMEPYYGLFLIGLNKSWENVQTACVSARDLNFYLKIDPEFWKTLSHSKRMGLLKHELLHIAFFHVTDFGHLTNHEIANIAMDIEINQYIRKEWLPEGGTTIDSFPELNLEPKKGTHYYYEKLLQEQQKNQQSVKACVDAMVTGESSVTLPNGQTVNLPDHNWEEEVGANVDEATKKLMNAQIGHLLNQVADQVKKSQGAVPGEMAEILKRINALDPPKFDWRGYMRKFIGRSTKYYTKLSRRRMNKRIPDFPGMKILEHKSVLVAIDTSASVSTKELKEFLNEIYHIQKIGTEVTIIQCDTAISYIGKFNPRKDFEVHGRGCTKFQPVIDYYNENLNKYNALFYLTDGEAPAPTNCKGSVLWVLSEQSTKTDHLPQTTIQLN